MRIGIISMQKVVNYGSFMQAYALRQLIKEATGEEAKFIDIEKGRALDFVKKEDTKSRVRRLLNIIFSGKIIEKMKDKIYSKKLYEQFSTKFYDLLNLTEEDNYVKYDNVVIGSDEVFHCCQNTPWGFTTQLYGNVKNAKNVFSYAASFGATTLNQIKENNLDSDIKQYLERMHSISVRDNNSKYIIENLLNKTPEEHLDPVLLWNFTQELNNTNTTGLKRDYLLVYSYIGRINDKNDIKEILKFAKDRNLEIVTIFCRYNWADKCIFPETPFQVLKYYQDAKYVITDTFHGSIFSIIQHKQFCTLVRKTNKEKLESLFKKFNLEDRIVTKAYQIFGIIDKTIDYKKVDLIREQERKRAIKYLKDNIING